MDDYELDTFSATYEGEAAARASADSDATHFWRRPVEQESSFDVDHPRIVDPQWRAGELVEGQREQILAGAVDAYYRALDLQGYQPEVMQADTAQFGLRGDRLFLKAFPNVSLYTKDGRFRNLKSFPVEFGASIRQALLGREKALPARVKTLVQSLDQELAAQGAAAGARGIEDLPQVMTATTDAIERTLSDPEIQRALNTIDDPPLRDISTPEVELFLAKKGYHPLREIRGLMLAEKQMTTLRGHLAEVLAKGLEIDKEIAHRRRKALGAPNEEARTFQEQKIAELEETKRGFMVVASELHEDFRTQFSRIRETLHRVLDEDVTLGQKLRTLFREQGITIASILSAIGLAISTIVLAISNAVRPPPPVPPPGPTPPGPPGPVPPGPTPGPEPGGFKEWLRQRLRDLGRLLAKLAGKAAAALPGIIGAIVSWLLKTLGTAAGWLAGNLWALAVAIGGLLLLAAREWLASERKRQ